MTSFQRYTRGIVPLLLLGSCANLIGLSDYETGEASNDDGGGGENETGGRGGTAGTDQGGVSGTGAKPGVGGESDGGDASGGTLGGRISRGGATADGGMAGEPDGGQPSTGGATMNGGTTTAGGGTGGMGGVSGSGAAGNAGTGGTGGSRVCTEITPINNRSAIVSVDTTSVAAFILDIAPELGGALPDTYMVQFWDGGGFDGALTGSFVLDQSGADSNYATCSRCLVLFQDENAATGIVGKTFFQTEGTLTVPQNSTHMSGFGTFTLDDITLREVTINPDNNVSTVVPGGDCLHISALSYAREMPTNWDCVLDYYSDSDCDCGCGQLDPTCPSSSAGVCEYCWCNGASTCTPSEVVASSNWLCN